MYDTMAKKALHTDASHEDGVEKGDILLFRTRNSIIAVSSPTKVQILTLALNGPVSESEVVTQTGKARSTITKHLHDLENDGLISTSADPHDTRRRIITLISEKIGCLTMSDWNAQPRPAMAPGTAPAMLCNDITSFFRFSMVTFRTQAMMMGLNLDPVMRQTGVQMGAVLAPNLAAKTVEGVVEKIAAFWKNYGLGTVTLAGTAPLSVEVRDCFECADLPVTGHCVCAFDNGALSAIFSHHLKIPVSAIEEECYSKGNNRCLFVISPVEG